MTFSLTTREDTHFDFMGHVHAQILLVTTSTSCKTCNRLTYTSTTHQNVSSSNCKLSQCTVGYEIIWYAGFRNTQPKGAYKYYVSKEVGEWGGQLLMFADKVGGWRVAKCWRDQKIRDRYPTNRKKDLFVILFFSDIFMWCFLMDIFFPNIALFIRKNVYRWVGIRKCWCHV